MEAEELMIGNLVFIDNEKYHPKLKNIPLEVTAITPNLDSSGWTYSISLKHINQKPNVYYETYSQFIKWVKPIPLTKEWLLRFGFRTLGNESYIIDEYCHSQSVVFRVTYNNKLWMYGYTIIKSIHKLQNLYFGLTDEILKPSK